MIHLVYAEYYSQFTEYAGKFKKGLYRHVSHPEDIRGFSEIPITILAGHNEIPIWLIEEIKVRRLHAHFVPKFRLIEIELMGEFIEPKNKLLLLL